MVLKEIEVAKFFRESTTFHFAKNKITTKSQITDNIDDFYTLVNRKAFKALLEDLFNEERYKELIQVFDDSLDQEDSNFGLFRFADANERTKAATIKVYLQNKFATSYSIKNIVFVINTWLLFFDLKSTLLKSEITPAEQKMIDKYNGQFDNYLKELNAFDVDITNIKSEFNHYERIITNKKKVSNRDYNEFKEYQFNLKRIYEKITFMKSDFQKLLLENSVLYNIPIVNEKIDTINNLIIKIENEKEIVQKITSISATIKETYNEGVHKKKKIKGILILALLVAILIPAVIFVVIPYSSFSTAFSFGSNNTITITGPKDNENDEIIIDDNLWNKTVATIQDNAFMGNSVVKKVTLPYTIKTIGAQAFSDCPTLTTLVVNSITPPTLGSDAFTNSDQLSILVPEDSYQAYLTSWHQYEEIIFPNYNANDQTDKVCILFDSMGGTTVPNVESLDSNTFYEGVLAPTKLGYVFDGWWLSDDNGLTTQFNFNDTKVRKNMKLYAKWNSANYKIIYDYQGATSNNQTEKKDVAYQMAIGALVEPTKEGYTFGGWFTAKDGLGLEITNEYIYAQTSDIVLYACWLANEYTISFDYQEATANDSVETIKGYSGKALGTLPNPAKTGFVFAGWYYLVNQEKVLFTKDTVFDEAQDILLQARWKTEIYFDTQGGNYLVNKDVYQNELIGELPVPSKEGCQFGGWFTQPGGKGSQLFSTTPFSYTSEITIYAKWKVLVSFNYQNATGGDNPLNQEMIYASTITNLPLPTKVNNTFNGWFTQPGGKGKKYDVNEIFNEAGAMTFYASWKTNVYFDYQGANSGNSTESSEVLYGSELGTLPIPLKNGNTFVGWFAQIGGSGVNYNQDSIFNSNSPITLYAAWKTTIVFDYQGADGGNRPNSKEVIYNSLVGILPEPTKTDNTFMGWYTAPGGEGVPIDDTYVFDSHLGITLYAKWKTTITFNYNGADGAITVLTKEVIYNAPIGELPQPTKTGVTFAGWQYSGLNITINSKYTYHTPIEVVAQWTVALYLDYQDADSEIGVSVFYVTSNDFISSLPTPSKSGYTFAGWWSEPLGKGIQFKTGDIYSYVTSKSAYACWKAKLTFDYQGATDDNALLEKTVTYHDVIDTLPIPKKNGSLNVFLGWNKASDGSGAYLDKDDPYDYGDCVYYAIWQMTLTFDYQGADDNNDVLSLDWNFNKTINNLPTPSKTNNEFKGWYTQIGGNGQLYVNDETILLETGACTLYACWELTLTFDYQGADGANDVINVTSIYNAPICLIPTPTKTNNTFIGWFTEVGGKGKLYQSESTILSEIGNCTLYVGWMAVVTFDYQGATSNHELISVEGVYNATMPTLPEPLKTGNSFVGWYTEVGTDGKKYISEETIFTEVGACTLYAGWKTTIAFDIFGGDGLCDDLDVIYNHTVNDLPEPTKSGYSFVGWFDGEGNHITKDSVYLYATNVTLIARWGTVIMLDYQGATSNNDLDRLEVFNSMKVGSIPQPEKTNNVFLGWYTAPGKDGVLYTEDTLYFESGSITLYAGWKVTVTFDYQGAEGEVESIDAIYNAKIGDLPIPVKTDNVFMGWYTEVGQSGKLYLSETTFDEIGNCALYASWQAMITFDYQGADGANEVVSLDAIYNAPINELPNPTKTGNTFIGWYTVIGAGGRQYLSNMTDFTEIGNCYLYAAWKATVTFDYQGTEGDVATLDAIYNAPIGTLPVPVKAGNTFLGWYLDKGQSGKEYVNTTIFTEAGACILYAAWKATITFDYQGANGAYEVNEKEMTYMRELGLLPTPTKIGNTFLGWYIKNNDERIYVNEASLYQDIADFTLYAGWSNIITFNYQGADGDNDIPLFIATYNDVIGLLPTPTKTNNTFLGWYTEVGAQGRKYVANDTIYLEDGNIIFYAAWQTTLTFDYTNADGNIGEATKNVIYNNTIGELPYPTKVGYEFIGWFTGIDGGGILIKLDTIYLVNSHLTVYAYFEIETYQISFNSNDGEEISPLVVTYGETYTLPTPTRNGYIFNQWFEANDGGNGSGNEISSILTINDLGENEAIIWIYAKWDDAEATAFGIGTEVDPYRIYTVAQLSDLSSQVNNGNNFSGKYFNVKNNIVVNGNWIPIGNNNFEPYYSATVEATSRRFMGTFNGEGNVISHYSVNLNGVDTYNGLFGYIGQGGIVSNVNVENVSISGNSTRNSGSKGGAHSGAIAGLNSGVIINCTTLSGMVVASATLDTHVGGIAGYMFVGGAQILNCTNSAIIDGYAGRWTSHGGICGSANNSVINNCTNNGHINGTVNGPTNMPSRYNLHGGIAGVNAGEISLCTSNGDVSGVITNQSGNAYASYIGGICGYFHNSSGSANYGTVDDNKLSITVNPIIVSCINSGSISGSSGSNGTLSAKGTIVGLLEFTTGRNSMTIQNATRTQNYTFTLPSNVIAVSGVGRCVVVG